MSTVTPITPAPFKQQNTNLLTIQHKEEDLVRPTVSTDIRAIPTAIATPNTVSSTSTSEVFSSSSTKHYVWQEANVSFVQDLVNTYYQKPNLVVFLAYY